MPTTQKKVHRIVYVTVAIGAIGFIGFLIAPLFLGSRLFGSFEIASWILGALAVVGFSLIGRGVWWAWFVNILCQMIWIVYWAYLGRPGPIITNVVYILVFIQNAYRWNQTYHKEKNLPSNQQTLISLIPKRRRTEEIEEDDDKDLDLP